MLDMHELYWAAGFLEGEGCFRSAKPGAISVQACQVQVQPLERLQKLFGGLVRPKVCRNPRPSWQQAHVWTLNGVEGAGVMMTVWALMSPRRRDQIECALVRWRQTPPDKRALVRVMGVCKRGHPMTTGNVRLNAAGSRVCRECVRLATVERLIKARRSAAPGAQIVLDTWQPHQMNHHRISRAKSRKEQS